MDILITDVTEMQRGNYCVAGWELAAGKMVRPLPGGANWTAALITQHRVSPGVTLRVTPHGSSSGKFPHRTEDTPIYEPTIINAATGFSDWMGPAAPSNAKDLGSGFDGHIRHNSEWQGTRQGVHVPAGTQCSSWTAIRVQRPRLRFVEEFEKLKAIVHDGVASYKLAVSSLTLKEAWRQGGLPAVGTTLPASDIFCVRVGLARPFGGPPDKCYLMVNGVL